MKKRYFGTDGIRNRVGQGMIRPDQILKLGWATGKVLKARGESKVMIGKDTRISGYMFESALEAGFISAGVDVMLLGPMPTPAIAYLTQTFHADAGIVISASHNPHYDNGIKFFSSKGKKISDEVELEIEQAFEQEMDVVPSELLGKAKRIEDAAGRYIEFCKSTYEGERKLDGLNIVLDCSNGATYHIAPSVFKELGAKVTTIGDTPDGININQGCGATHMDALCEAVVDQGADLGIAFDGDGDRVMMVDHLGEVVDGDEILFILATGRPAVQGVVGTVMSNLGLEVALEREGIALKRASVGDRYVMEQLVESGWALGAEPSGHVLCLDKTTTGDGIVAALQVLSVLINADKTLNEIKKGMSKYPNVLKNVRVESVVGLQTNQLIQQKIQEVEEKLGADGRVLIRASGTEPLIRVMVEGKGFELVESCANQLAEAVESEFS
ncbi:phosphoglucosamine mutase [Thiomicrorhabdus sp.]|uniref:phosphoglucosamine mutase n=1 Tax=Thiomicrorhabdus sp. TaxID=2039724 RepID=UPI0035621D38